MPSDSVSPRRYVVFLDNTTTGGNLIPCHGRERGIQNTHAHGSGHYYHTLQSSSTFTNPPYSLSDRQQQTLWWLVVVSIWIPSSSLSFFRGLASTFQSRLPELLRTTSIWLPSSVVVVLVVVVQAYGRLSS